MKALGRLLSLLPIPASGRCGVSLRSLDGRVHLQRCFEKPKHTARLISSACCCLCLGRIARRSKRTAFSVLGYLRKCAGLELHVTAGPA
jgi:hypothetical protein